MKKNIKMQVACPICVKIKGNKCKLFFHQFDIFPDKPQQIKEAILKCEKCKVCSEIGKKVVGWMEDKKAPKQDKILFRIVKEYKKKFGVQNKKIIFIRNKFEEYSVYGVLVANKGGVISEAKVNKVKAGALINRPNAEIIVV